MKQLLLIVPILLLAGCGSSSAAPKAVPTPTPTPVSVRQIGARFSHPPPMTINLHHRYTAQVRTNRGNFTISLLPRMAPLTVNNFVFLARHHYYDGNKIFRIIATFMIQTGDPTGTGMGGPGYTFKDEKVTTKYTPGTVAMANSGPNTNGSQFFVVVGPDASGLKPKYTIFGKVTKGMNVVMNIANTPVAQNPLGELSQPLADVHITRVTIYESA